MPIYEYACRKCGKVVELLQKTGVDHAGVVCPDCGEDNWTKVFSVTAPPQMADRSGTACSIGKNPGNCGGCCSGCH